MCLKKKKKNLKNSGFFFLGTKFFFSLSFFETLKMEVLKNLHFSPETPFGLSLYPFFEKAYEAVIGQKASDFHYTQDVTPLSTVNEGKYSLERWRDDIDTVCLSDHYLHHLFYSHLWRSVLIEGFTCFQVKDPFYDSQRFVDFGLWYTFGIDDRANLPHHLPPRIFGCYLWSVKLDSTFRITLLS